MTLCLGNSLGAGESRLAWARMLLGVRQVTVVPHAVRPERHQAMLTWCWSHVRRSGSLARVVLGEPVAEPGRGDLVLLPGGNTYELLEMLRASGGLQALRDLVTAGGDVYAGSAGALVLGASIAAAACFDEDTVGSRDLQGADVLGGLSVVPHWDREVDLRTPWPLGQGMELALPDGAFVVVDRGRLRSRGPAPALVRERGADGSIRHERWLPRGRDLTLPLSPLHAPSPA